MYGFKSVDELEQENRDRKVLEEIMESRKASKRSFASVINGKEIVRHELDALMF